MKYIRLSARARVGAAWSKLESNLPSLEGRKMYGAYYDQDKVYRARYCDILSIDLLFIVVLRQGEMVF
jgi:hypothetical protein